MWVPLPPLAGFTVFVLYNKACYHKCPVEWWMCWRTSGFFPSSPRKSRTERATDSPVRNVWHVASCVFLQAATPQPTAAVFGHSTNLHMMLWGWLVCTFSCVTRHKSFKLSWGTQACSEVSFYSGFFPQMIAWNWWPDSFAYRQWWPRWQKKQRRSFIRT